MADHENILSDESPDASWAYEKQKADNIPAMAEQLCDWWLDRSGTFTDYPGYEDAIWEALRDAAEIMIAEAIEEVAIGGMQ